MGKPVTLDSDDVEVLLNAAAAIRHVENALEAVRQDPAMIRLYKSGKIGQALDRCNRARAEAIRETPVGPPSSWEPTEAHLTLLYRLHMAEARGLPLSGRDLDIAETLVMFGLCVRGQVNQYVNWGDKTQEMIGPALEEDRYKITARGRLFMLQREPLERTLPLQHPGRSLPNG